MKYQSTRNHALTASPAAAVLRGIAPDGGLYMPEAIPVLDWQSLMKEDTLTMSARILSALLPEAVRNFLARQATRLDNAAELIAGRSPERILRLGFAVVRTGDEIEIDIPGRSIRLAVDDAEIAARMAAQERFRPAGRDRRVPASLRAYARLVSSADKGAVRIVDDNEE